LWLFFNQETVSIFVPKRRAAPLPCLGWVRRSGYNAGLAGYTGNRWSPMSVCSTSPARIRPMRTGDLSAVLALQQRCYQAHLIESADALASRHRLSPSTCWVAERDAELLGYLFAHPWQGEALPALDTPLAVLPEAPDTLFIHDLALHPAARGQRLAPRLIDAVMQQARERRLRYTRLVAVQDAADFWSRHGYRTFPLPAAKLASYGPGAVGMQRPL